MPGGDPPCPPSAMAAAYYAACVASAPWGPSAFAARTAFRSVVPSPMVASSSVFRPLFRPPSRAGKGIGEAYVYRPLTSLDLSDTPEISGGALSEFKKEEKIQVEVVRFGRLGASVDVIGKGHREDDCIGEDEPPLGRGLVLQREIQYFRSGRGGLDVVVGEVLPAYVEDIREDGRIHVSLRPPGGKAKAGNLSKTILDTLKWTQGGTLPIGDKSTPAEINAEFPGASKGAFKKAVAALYKKGLVQPGPNSISLMSTDGRDDE